MSITGDHETAAGSCRAASASGRKGESGRPGGLGIPCVSPVGSWGRCNGKAGECTGLVQACGDRRRDRGTVEGVASQESK